MSGLPNPLPQDLLHPQKLACHAQIGKKQEGIF